MSHMRWSVVAVERLGGADAARGFGNPVRFITTAGQVHDILQAEDLISGFSFEKLLADMGFDSNRFRACIAVRNR
jgi:transposase